MRFPANCLVVAVIASLLPGRKFCTKRNQKGRLHFFWKDRKGKAWRFYQRGAGNRSYLRNSLYIGEITAQDD